MRISERLRQPAPVISFELFPPKSEAGEQALRRLLREELAALGPDFMSVTYGAGGSTQASTLQHVNFIKGELGIEAMPHLTCVGHSRAELKNILQRLQAAGVENLMALRGDPPRGETEFVPAVDGLAYGAELAAFVRREHFPFCLGGGCYPEVHPEATAAEDDIRYLKQKVTAGAEFLITQLFFEPETYFRFVERARSAGIGVPIVPGVLPVQSLEQIERFTTLCGAKLPPRLRHELQGCRDEDGMVDAGIDWASEQCSKLLAGGAPGIHFYALNKARSVRGILANLGLRGCPAAAREVTVLAG
ncbi:MAG: methylenetetrahydrofolate reductase [NAD(P)H] [Chloroflexi bacterium]|nr:methylenetetrahydrofolate reductase [NAD(P)H] [Chloroflexota bacterium]